MRETLACRIVAVFLAFTASALAASSSVLRGDVKDSEGAVIRGALILLRADKAGGFGKTNTDQTLTSDAMGRFEAGLGDGFYDVCVMADAFAPQCRKVLVHGTNGTNQHFHLKIDLEVEKRIGDSVQ
jgi:hypothetical protein